MARAALSSIDRSVRRVLAQMRHAAPEAIRGASRRVMAPERFQRHVDGTTRTSQITTAVLLLGPLIVVNLVLIRVWNSILADLFGGFEAGAQTDIAGFIIVAATLGAFIISAWMWFQFVRTSAFGWMSWDD